MSCKSKGHIHHPRHRFREQQRERRLFEALHLEASSPSALPLPKEDAWQKVEEMEKMMKINSAFEKKMIGPFLSASSQKMEEDAWQKVEDDGEDDHLASSSSSDEA